MLTTTIDGVKYEVREQFDVHYTMANALPVIRRREPSVRRCGCCDECAHVERFHEEVHSFAEAIERSWLVMVDVAHL